jgi:hypothetical protein
VENTERRTSNVQGPIVRIKRWMLRVGRCALKRLDARDRIGFARLREIRNEIAALFRFLDRLNDLVEIRPLAGLEFGMEQFPIGANFEGAAARRNKNKRFNALAEFENLGRQTDGLRRVVSNDAVFD